jgi:hypothetical protein
MQREPEHINRLGGLALAYHALGRTKEADAALAEYVAKYHADSAFDIAELFAFRGENDRAFEWLERAYTPKSLERDPRYATFLRRRCACPPEAARHALP